MSRRMYYNVDEPTATLDRVLIVEGAGSATVYCPPGLAGGPWLDRCASMDAAMDLASLLVKQHGQAGVLLTRDKDEWWLNGLPWSAMLTMRTETKLTKPASHSELHVQGAVRYMNQERLTCLTSFMNSTGNESSLLRMSI